ncbi:MAG: glycosyltransferase family 2 protein [Candidatus Schekmanbacteria bacterium]|nr:glycosyltransferase family 2 protein [Candidatus Schekmanbacteria bacterium]
MDTLISVVLPACNEEGNLEKVVGRINESFHQESLKGNIIIINDGSSDKTGEIAESLKRKNENIRVFHHRKRTGLTSALVTGFSHADGDIIIFLPSDMQSDPVEDIPKLLSVINEGYDLAVGCRVGRKEFKVLASRLYNFVCYLLFGVKAKDQNWIKAFRKEVINELPLRANWHRYIIPIAYHEGFKVKEVETNWYERNSGKSKFGARRLFEGIIDLVVVKFRLSFMKKPMYFFGATGGTIFSFGFLINMLQVISDYMLSVYDIKEHIPMLILGVALMILGVQVISLGFLGEMVVEYFSEKKEK